MWKIKVRFMSLKCNNTQTQTVNILRQTDSDEPPPRLCSLSAVAAYSVNHYCKATMCCTKGC